MSQPSAPNVRMKFPDGLRAIAAMIVVLPHSVALFVYWKTPSMLTRAMVIAAAQGHLGVQIFFVLSGFVIAFTLRNERITGSFFGKFMLRRSIRLDPPYWAAIALSYLYLVFQALSTHKVLNLPTTPQLIAHLFYLQDILHYGNINVVFWTLCIEIQFYMAFCLLLWICQLSQHFKQRLFLVAFVVSLAWPTNLIKGDAPNGLFLPYWYAFLAGAIVWWAVECKVSRFVGYVMVATLFLLSIARFDPAVFVVASTAGALLAAAKRGNLYRWLNIKVFQLLGKLSYCIYLVHVPIAGVIIGLQVRLHPQHETVSYFLLLLVWLVTIGTAYLLHVTVEVPALRWSKYFKTRGSQAVNPVLVLR